MKVETAARLVPAWRRTLADLLALTKPWIVALLMITTWAGMFIAQGGAPPLGTFLLTTLGGALAAGGANALNSYIDRDIDGRMNRTARRPIPRGALAPRTAFVFGVGASAAAVLILGLGVNGLAAALALLGNVYYVFIYTLWLKRRYPSGIVFGGVAGAIPPLVGWAAARGTLSPLAVLLFLIVLYWTPPHTWALGLMLRADYERVGVPLLPVVHGEAETARQVWLYSLQMVAITLVPAALGLLGAPYALAALALGGLFLRQAWLLRRTAHRALARNLYKFSQVYLALLMLAMVCDRLL
jgi:protoheme IX farnesyltransferase